MDKNEKKFRDAAKTIEGLVDTYTSSTRLMNRLGEDIVKQIKTRTRLGYGVTKSGKRVRLEPLSDSYKKQRKGKIRFFTAKSGKVVAIEPLSNKELNSFRASKSARRQNRKNRKFVKKPPNLNSNLTKPAKSNLTATGLMLNSLTRRVVGSRIFISLANATGKDMWGKFSRVTSSQKANFQAKMGRRFLDLAKFEQKIFRNRVTKEMLAISERAIRKL